MSRIIFFAAIIICTFFSIAQPGPRQDLKATDPTLINETENEPVYIRSVSIKIRANEHAATTHVEMEIYNPGNSIMDGTIEFSLHDGQVISGFSLDIEGKMRQGVIVEKQKARKTYEAIVNRKVDPGLLELTAGNNYRIRVYPVNAHGSRKVSFTIDQQMGLRQYEARYILPLVFGRAIENYKLEIETGHTKYPPVVKEGFLENLVFEGGRLMHEQKNVMLNKPHSFAIPLEGNAPKICVDNSSYFSARIPFTGRSTDKNSPASLAVFWDVSSSAKNRDIKKEIDFLQAYIEKFKIRKLKLVLFNNEIQEIKYFNDPASDFSSTRNFLQSLDFDGATNFDILNEKGLTEEENIIFSDGINNFGGNHFNLDRPLHTVLTSAIANSGLLKYLSNASGGHFIELGSGNIEDLIKSMSFPAVQYLEGRGKNVADLVIRYQDGYIDLSGKLVANSGRVDIEISQGNEKIKKQIEITKGADCGDDLGYRAWKAAWINYESLVSYHGEDKIKKAGSDLGVVTPYTSLIVLETLNDYIQFNILPPADLLEEYNKNVIVMNRKTSAMENENKENKDPAGSEIDGLVYNLESRSRWWNKRFPLKPVKSTAVAHAAPVIVNDAQTAQQTRVNSNATVRAAEIPPPSVKNEQIIVTMDEAGSSMEEVVVTGFANTRKTYTMTSSQPAPNALAGKVAGLSIEASRGSEMKTAVNESLMADSANVNQLPGNHQLTQLEDKLTINRKQLLLSKKAGLYPGYLLMKKSREGSDPSFYFEVAGQLYKNGSVKEAKRVLSNLAELQLEDPQLLRAMAYMLESWKEFKTAIMLYEKVLNLRNDEPQSYRDLALAKNAVGEYQQAVDLLYKALTAGLDKMEDEFDGISSVMLNELNAIIHKNRSEVDIKNINRSVISSLPVDLRVVVDWNKDQTDIDLHIVEPNGEECSYSSNETQIGGLLSDDMTEGYGPEEYSIRKAVKGKYRIRVNYYGDNYQREQVPSFIKISIYRNFGRPNQTVEISNLILSGKERMIDVGEVVF